MAYLLHSHDNYNFMSILSDMKEIKLQYGQNYKKVDNLF